MVYVGILVLVPMGVLAWRTFKPGLSEFFDALTTESALHAFQVTRDRRRRSPS